MSSEIFTLTVRRDDVLELYADQTRFRLFSSANGAPLIYTGLFQWNQFTCDWLKITKEEWSLSQ